MESIKLKFLGNEYLVKTDADSNYLQSIASYLEEKFIESSSGLANVKIPLPLFLATLKVADDLFRLKSDFEEYKNREQEHTHKLVGLLERELGIPEGSEVRTEDKAQGKDSEGTQGSLKGWS